MFGEGDVVQVPALLRCSYQSQDLEGGRVRIGRAQSSNSSSWLCKERTRISAVGGSYVVIWLEGGDWRTHLGLEFCELCKHVLT